ncbi:hypothetical protein ACFO0A_09640 [Novosphingobium tardum]|uniref:Elongation factor P n=1 Tax=Novosphingobium tardum TaxID=1538021 RepID=A0ABV8RSL4_9SPHN
MIKPIALFVFSALASLAAGPAVAADGGAIAVLAQGNYRCELPGSAAGQSSRPVPAVSFTITTASRYIAADGSIGSYLLIGKTVTMTSGALSGTRYLRVRMGFLRRIEANGQPGDLRCVRDR